MMEAMTLSDRDELHLAMGEFLSECSNLENMLITMMMVCQNEKSFHDIHREMLNETFGTRIREFKKVCNAYQFLPEQRKIVEEAYVALDELLPRRNMIVHGVTFELGLGGAPPRAYRIGQPKGNIDYMNQFIRNNAQVEHSFPVERVREAIVDCRELASKLGSIVNHTIKIWLG